jgi:hypothetical protein
VEKANGDRDGEEELDEFELEKRAIGLKIKGAIETDETDQAVKALMAVAKEHELQCAAPPRRRAAPRRAATAPPPPRPAAAPPRPAAAPPRRRPAPPPPRPAPSTLRPLLQHALHALHALHCALRLAPHALRARSLCSAPHSHCALSAAPSAPPACRCDDLFGFIFEGVLDANAVKQVTSHKARPHVESCRACLGGATAR